MFEIHMLPVGTGSKSGDAITLRLSHPDDGRQVVVVVDAGYASCGQDVVDHVRTHYGTSRVDLAVSTHPDQDHLNGLQAVVEQLDVVELLVHRPREHHDRASEYGNVEAIDGLLAAAARRGTVVTEPFLGLQRFSGAVTVLGPTRAYYEELLGAELAVPLVAAAAGAVTVTKSLWSRAMAAVLDRLPVEEKLRDDGVTSNRNNTSVIVFVQAGPDRLLLTGDAGVPGLGAAADMLDTWMPRAAFPLRVLQAPHHGSRRNLGPSLLDRLLGPVGRPFGMSTVTMVSASGGDAKHPSPKVTNAVARRGAPAFTNGAVTMRHASADAPPPVGSWMPLLPVPPMSEDDDE